MPFKLNFQRNLSLFKQIVEPGTMMSKAGSSSIVS